MQMITLWRCTIEGGGVVKDDERLHVRIRAAPRHSDGRRTSAETSAEDLERHHDFPPAHGAALWYRFHDDVGAATTDTLVTALRKGVRARFGEADGATLLCGRPFAKPQWRRWSSKKSSRLPRPGPPARIPPKPPVEREDFFLWEKKSSRLPRPGPPARIHPKPPV